jgi:hypothetical protein
VSTLLEATPAPVTAGAADDLTHVTCCDDNVAMCGENVSGQRWVDDSEETTCPICAWAEEADLACTIPGCPGLRVMPAWS